MRVILKLAARTISPAKLSGAFFSHGCTLKAAKEYAQALMTENIEVELSGTLTEINSTFNPLGILAEAVPEAVPATGTEG